MTPELEKYFDDFNELFHHHGYARLLEEITNKINNLNDISRLGGEKDLFYAKGQIDAYKTILSMQDIVTLAREQAEEEDVQDI